MGHAPPIAWGDMGNPIPSKVGASKEGDGPSTASKSEVCGDGLEWNHSLTTHFCLMQWLYCLFNGMVFNGLDGSPPNSIVGGGRERITGVYTFLLLFQCRTKVYKTSIPHGESASGSQTSRPPKRHRQHGRLVPVGLVGLARYAYLSRTKPTGKAHHENRRGVVGGGGGGRGAEVFSSSKWYGTSLLTEKKTDTQKLYTRQLCIATGHGGAMSRAMRLLDTEGAGGYFFSQIARP